MVSASSPRAIRASRFPPPWWSALRSMARRMGVPFRRDLALDEGGVEIRPGGDLGDDVGCCRPAAGAFLDEERQEQRVRAVRLGGTYVGVQVPQRREDLDQLRLEGALRPQIRAVSRLQQLVLEQPQPLHRVDRVAGALGRQVHVGLLEDDDRLFDDQPAVLQRQVARPG